ncbi:serine hydrolase [Sphingomonas sp.]|uniref:serine hydrolase domain-containing protein n=1 Tax=Sphingomonas sp. TaxID=28214 RepID=UPI00286CC1D0|nr:serine hydrolase [Sphingomonas sp.]
MRNWRAIRCGLLILLGGAAIAQDSAQIGAPPSLAKLALAAPRTGQPSAAAVSGEPAPHALTKSDLDAWLDGYMPYALHNSDIPGAVVVVVKDGQFLTARGFGYSDLEKRTPVDPERTLFRPGSVSKLVTWTAVMQQVEQGKLNLDKDVNTYLDFKIPPFEGQPVTLRQIMTHTGGFQETSKEIIFYDAKKVRKLGDYLKAHTPKRIYAPGTTPAYSNWATALAAYLVERTSGQSFDDYLDQHVFAPLGMRNSTFRQPLPAQFKGQVSVGYQAPGADPKGFELIGPAPAGSLSASGADMGRFMIAHLANGRGILQPATAAMMHNSPLDKINPRTLFPGLNRMELGFFETNANGREVIGHLGDTSAFHTSLHLLINDNVGFYVSFNSPGKGGAVGPLREAMFEHFADRYFPAPPANPTIVPAKLARQHSEMMAGLWQNSRREDHGFVSLLNLIGQTAVSVGPKGELVIPALTAANGRPREWVEVTPFMWQDKYSHQKLAAQVVEGKVVRWSFDEISPFMVFDRVPASLSGAWLKPALYASLVILLLTLLYWPVTWYVRRRYKAAPSVSGRALQAYRATRIMAAANLLVLAGWGVLVTLLFKDLENLAGSFDLWLWVLQILGAIVFVGAVGISAWNAWLTLNDGRRWTRKLWSVLIVLATLVILYVALRYGLLAMSVSY